MVPGLGGKDAPVRQGKVTLSTCGLGAYADPRHKI
jgi:hypothetical protein